MKYKLCLPVSFGRIFLERESQSKEQQKQFCITCRISIFYMVSSVIHVEDVSILFSELCVCVPLSLLSLDFSSLWQKVFKMPCVEKQILFHLSLQLCSQSHCCLSPRVLKASFDLALLRKYGHQSSFDNLSQCFEQFVSLRS